MSPLHDLGLQIEEEPLAAQTTGIAGQLPPGADDTMAWEQDAQRVPAHGSAHLLSGCPVSQLAGQVTVGRGLAVRYLADHRPDALLVLVAASGRRHLELPPLAGEVLADLLANNIEAGVAVAPEASQIRPIPVMGKVQADNRPPPRHDREVAQLRGNCGVRRVDAFIAGALFMVNI